MSATTTYLANCLQGESKVEPVADLYDSSRRDDMVDALVGLEGQIEQGEDRLIVSHIGGLEDCPRGLARLCGVEIILALAQQTLAGNVVEIAKAYASATLEALLDETCADSVGTACRS